jgi:dihydrofolate reductase
LHVKSITHQPLISIVAAMDMNYGIGYKGALPWAIPIKPDWDNLFKITAGCKMIMGKRSFLDENRVWSATGNFVLTSDTNLVMPAGFERVPSLAQALALSQDETEIFVLGGQKLFEEAIPIATNLHLTFVKESFNVDRFFPKFDKNNYVIVSNTTHVVGPECPFEIDIVHFKKLQ